MKKWRYYFTIDKERKTIKEIYAEDIHEATAIASRMESLTVKDFLFHHTIELI